MALERALSKLGLATRSVAKALILEGRVRIDGRIVQDPRRAFVPERVRIEIDGREVRPPDTVTIALHKPRAVVTTRQDPQGRVTVYDLIADLGVHVIPVGRLDYATSGLLLMTNDTRLADWITEPVNRVPRVYLVTVRGRVSEGEAARVEGGVRVDGMWLHAGSVVIQKASGRESHLRVELVAGRNREIRRLMSAIGHEVTRLKRIAFGGISLDALEPGAWRYVSARELARAFPGAARARIQRKKSGSN